MGYARHLLLKQPTKQMFAHSYLIFISIAVFVCAITSEAYKYALNTCQGYSFVFASLPPIILLATSGSSFNGEWLALPQWHCVESSSRIRNLIKNENTQDCFKNVIL